MQWLKQNIFPGWLADYAKKKINFSTKKLKDFNTNVTYSNGVEEIIKQVENDLAKQIERKKIIEDKAKSVLSTISISVTAITFALINQKLTLGNSFNKLSIVFLFLSVLFFTMATIRAIQALNIRAYYFVEANYKITDNNIEIISQKDKNEYLSNLVKNKLINDNTILKGSNYVYASFILVRNGILCFSIFFLFAIIDKAVYSKIIEPNKISLHFDLPIK